MKKLYLILLGASLKLWGGCCLSRMAQAEPSEIDLPMMRRQLNEQQKESLVKLDLLLNRFSPQKRAFHKIFAYPIYKNFERSLIRQKVTSYFAEQQNKNYHECILLINNYRQHQSSPR